MNVEITNKIYIQVLVLIRKISVQIFVVGIISSLHAVFRICKLTICRALTLRDH